MSIHHQYTLVRCYRCVCVSVGDVNRPWYHFVYFFDFGDALSSTKNVIITSGGDNFVFVSSCHPHFFPSLILVLQPITICQYHLSVIILFCFRYPLMLISYESHVCMCVCVSICIQSSSTTLKWSVGRCLAWLDLQHPKPTTQDDDGGGGAVGGASG